MPTKKQRKKYRKNTVQKRSFISSRRLIASLAVAGITLASGLVYLTQDNNTIGGSPDQDVATVTTENYENLLPAVLAGEYPVLDYLDDLVAKSPELSSAMGHELAGILYDPSIEELTVNIRQAIRGHVAEDRLEKWVKNEISFFKDAHYSEEGKLEEFTISSPNTELYGDAVQSYLLLPNIFYDNLTIENDNDARSILEHELDHIKDYYNGISFENELELTKDDLQNGEVSIEFYEALMETRAYYNQVKKTMSSLIGLEDTKYSILLLGNTALQYSENYRSLISTATTNKEKAIRSAQLQLIGDIVPEASGARNIDLRHTLLGYAETISISPD